MPVKVMRIEDAPVRVMRWDRGKALRLVDEADGAKNVYEHAKTKQMFEVPVGELTPEFFVAVQEQLNVRGGGPKAKAEPVVAAETPAAEPAPTA